MASEAEYNELEICLKQAQAEIGAALSSLSVEYHTSSNTTTGQRECGERPTPADRNANPVVTEVQNNNDRALTDFVSIFAANNLVADGLEIDCINGGSDESEWNFTLPANFRRRKSQPERPRTLTPPCTKTDKKRFRKRDWKFYVHGKYKSLIPVQKKHEYGFSPIKDSDCNIDLAKGGKTYRTEVVIVDKAKNLNVNDLNNKNSFVVDNLNKKRSELRIDLSDPNYQLLSNTINSSSSDGSDKQSCSQPSDLSTTSSATKSPPQENNQINHCVDDTTKQQNDHILNNEVHNRVQEIVSSNNGLLYSANCANINNVLLEKPGEKTSDSSVEMNDKETFTPSAFSPVLHENVNRYTIGVNSNLNGDSNVASNAVVKSPLPRRPIAHFVTGNNNNTVQHEGTMTRQISTESSSTSDAYYRESSISPNRISSPDCKLDPSFVLPLPLPTSLDKHETRLKSAGRSASANSSRNKSADRKSTKKRSKSKDGKITIRDKSPSKTERSREGKISCATQTHRSTKNYKPTTNTADHEKHDSKSIGLTSPNKSQQGNNVNERDSFDNDRIYKVPILPMPVSKRAAMESSTSSDESGDYKKVNITALRERFIQSRGKTKPQESGQNLTKKGQDCVEKSKKAVNSKHITVNSEFNIPCTASSQMNEVFSRDLPMQQTTKKSNSEFTPAQEMDSKMEKFDNDILENDMYNYEDSAADKVLVNGIDQYSACTLEECDYCCQMYSPQPSEFLYYPSEYDQSNDQIKCPVNQAENSGSLQACDFDGGSENNGLVFFLRGQQQQLQHDIINSDFIPPPPPPLSKPPLICASCSEKGEYIADDGSIMAITLREQRRMWTKPIMPVIVEDEKKSGDSDTETLQGSTVTLDKHTGIIVMDTSSASEHSVQQLQVRQNLKDTETFMSQLTKQSANRNINNDYNRTQDIKLTADQVKHREIDRSSSGNSIDDRKSSNKKTLPYISLMPTSSGTYLVEPVSPGAYSVNSLKSQSSFNSIHSVKSLTSANSLSSTNSCDNNSIGSQSESSSQSLLDKLHKKYYPNQYAKAISGSDFVVVNRQQGNTESQSSFSSQVSSGSNEGVITSTEVKETLNVPTVSGVSTSSFSPRLRRSAPRQAEKGEEGKPPPSPTSLGRGVTCSAEINKQNFEELQRLKEAQEIEAIEACKWLRAAGFPQYAQMYEDQQFPIEVTAVEKDHDFLDADSIQSIFRRLNTLNKCAGMKIETAPRKTNDESDEEEQCALSDKWRYQRSSRRWSRKDLDITELIPTIGTSANTNAVLGGRVDKLPVKSCSSQDSLLTDNDSASHCEDSPVPPKRSGGLNSKQNIPDTVQVHFSSVPPEEVRPVVNLFDNRDRTRAALPTTGGGLVNGAFSASREGSASPNLRRVQSEKVHGPKSFFKKIESFKTKKSGKRTRFPPGTKLEIGTPVVVNTDDMKERMERLGCKDISPKSLSSDMSEETNQLHADLNNSYTQGMDSGSDRSPVFNSGRHHTESMTSEESIDKLTKSPVLVNNNNNKSSTEIAMQTASKTETIDVNNSNVNHSTNLANNLVQSSVLTGKDSLSGLNNEESSDLDRVVFSLENLEAPPTLSSFPKVIPNGYIEMESGSQLNYRTGSFNLGSHSDDYRESLQSRGTIRAVSEDRERDHPVARRTNSLQRMNPDYRMSIYDNLGPDVDPQQELDKILQDLMENINGLNQSLGESESLLELGTFGLKGCNIPPVTDNHVEQLQVEEPLTKHLKQRDAIESDDQGYDNYKGEVKDSMDTSDTFYNKSNNDSTLTPIEENYVTFNINAATTIGNQTQLQQKYITTTTSNKSDIHEHQQPFSFNNRTECSNSSYIHSNNVYNNRNSEAGTLSLFSASEAVTTTTATTKVTGDNERGKVGGQQQHSVAGSVPCTTTVVLVQQQAAQDDLGGQSPQQNMDSNIPSTSQDVDSELEELPVEEEEEGEDGEEDDDDDDDDDEVHSSGGSSCSHHGDSDEGETHGSHGAEDGEESSDQPEGRERRDSGVGSSLTRAPSDRRRHRIRWHSFVKSHRPSLNSENLQISHMSAGQLMVLRKLCLLKVTGLMEKYSLAANRSGWNWAMPKFIKRFKAPDYKDKNVFGVPLLVTLQRTGQPLPQCMLYAMRCLRRTAKDAVGIFRKSGVRSRIQKLRDDIEAGPESIDFESLQPYDVADLIKQYFRELPECLLTNKLSETFISIFTHVPSGERLETLQCAVMLLPDENREVLQSLLLFLSDMASHSHHNQMTASNLAVCFGPSLFHMFGQRTNPGSSPKRGRKNAGIPEQKELQEQKAAHECLTTMISECKKLFMVPEDLLSKCRFSYIEQGDPVPLEELGKKRCSEDSSAADHTAYIEACIQGILKESRDKFKGWVTVSSPTNIELAYKKVGDGHPLRLWKCAVDVEAPPEEVLNRILRERHLWDVDLMKWRVIEKLDAQTEVFQYMLNSMAPHPSRDFCELRSWRTQLPKGACVLVSTSVEHHDGSLLGCVRAVILASRYLIEPCGAGKSRLTHICRIDVRGHTPEWYNKAHGHICATFMARVRDSFKQTLNSADGPETKI